MVYGVKSFCRVEEEEIFLFFPNYCCIKEVVQNFYMAATLPAWDKTFLVGVYNVLHGWRDDARDCGSDDAVVCVGDRDGARAVDRDRVPLGYDEETSFIITPGDPTAFCNVQEDLAEDPCGDLRDRAVGAEANTVWSRGRVGGVLDDIGEDIDRGDSGQNIARDTFVIEGEELFNLGAGRGGMIVVILL